MKLLLIITLLLSLNSFASYRLEINPSGNYAKMSIDCSTQDDCDSKLVKWIETQKFFKGTWKADAIGGIVSKTIVDDITMQETTVYFHPINFSINQVDISAEINEKLSKKARLDFLKNKHKGNMKGMPRADLIEMLELKGIL